MFLKLVKTAQIEIDGRSYALRYYERTTTRGGLRFSCEVLLDASDRFIVDDDTLSGLESTVERLAPATVYSRLLAS
jgi:hypothetical protein